MIGLDTIPPVARWLTQPSAFITEAAERRAAQVMMFSSWLFASLVLVQTIVFHLLAGNLPYFQPTPLWITFSAVGVMVAGGFLSRLGYHRSFARFGGVFGSVIVFISAFPRGDAPLNYEVFSFFAVIVVFLSVYLSVKEAILLLIFQSFLLFTLPLLESSTELKDVLGTLSFLWFMGFTIALVIFYYNRTQQDHLQELDATDLRYRLIFDSSVHVVMIHDGYTVLLCNTAAAQLCGYRTPEELIGKNFSDFIHPDDLKMVTERARHRLQGIGSPPERYTMRVLGKDEVVRWVDSQSRVIQFGNRKATLATAIDITHRYLIEEYLLRRVALDKIITTASTQFLNVTPALLSEKIVETLKLMGEFVQVDHSYVILFESYTGQTLMQTTHEWVAAGIASQKMLFKDVPITDYPWGYNRILKGETVSVPNVAHLPDELPDKAHLLKAGIQAYLELPLTYQSKVLGLVGFDSVTAPKEWAEDMVFLLRIVGEIFASALERHRAEISLIQRNRELETLNELSHILTLTLETQDLLRKVTRLVCEALEATSAYISHFDLEKNITRVLSEYVSPIANALEQQSDLGAEYGDLTSNNFPADTYHLLPTPHWIIYRDEIPVDHPYQQHMLQYGGWSILLVPMMLEGNRIGMIEIWDSRHRREFLPQEIQLIQAIASQTTIVLDRLRVYNRLQESEKRNQAVLKALPDLVIRQNGAGRFLDYTTNHPTPLGLTPEVLLNKYPQEIFPPAVAIDWLNLIQVVIRTEKMQILEFDFSLGSNLTYYEARIVKVSPDEVLTFVRDLTDIKESAQRQVDLAFEKERVRILESFISDASHDLRTPIASVKARLYLLRKADTPDKQARQIEVMEQEVIRLEHLIEDLLTMSQLDGNLMERTLIPLNLNLLLQDVAEANQLVAKNKQLDFGLELDENLPIILGNLTELNRLFTNLVSNAINYTPEGGKITFKSYATPEEIIIAVIDTGMGISPDDLPYIFDRFFRADKARNTDRGGTGLGLAIVRKIVELHRGVVEVESEVNQGTTFRLHFPRDFASR